MMRPFKTATLLTISLAAHACSASPTAPSSLDPTAPVTSTSALPTPAPVSQTLTGTWTGGGQTFTVTQSGTTASGMVAERTTTFDEGVTVTESAIVTGTVSETQVTLQMADRIIIRGAGVTMNCTAARSFTGTLSGNSLSGMMVGTAPLTCGNDPPAIAVPQVAGPMVYTRQ